LLYRLSYLPHTTAKQEVTSAVLVGFLDEFTFFRLQLQENPGETTKTAPFEYNHRTYSHVPGTEDWHGKGLEQLRLSDLPRVCFLPYSEE
jgi:hypothetical protein